MSDAAEKVPFYLQTFANHVIVNLHGPWDDPSSVTFSTTMNEVLGKKIADVVVECRGLVQLSPAWTRALVSVAQTTKRGARQFLLVGIPGPVQRQLKQEGLASTLVCLPSESEALVRLGHAKQQVLDVEFIAPFLSATVSVLQMQAQTTCKQGNVFRKKSNEAFTGDISGVIGLVSEKFTGSVVLSFPAATFLKIMSRMLGEEYSELNQEIRDGAGELTNIIFGQAKVSLNEKGFGIKTALPSIVSGKDHSVVQTGGGPRVAIPFESDAGEFVIEICLSS